ncbi:MAG: DUF4855 domain-containing protein [Bacteroidales bacterium]|nr:DUF4855 domain-containing protein [Bacteroidales bacterium]
MKKFRYIIPLLLTILASCGKSSEPEVKPANPAIRVEITSVDAFGATLSFQCIQTSKVQYGYGKTEGDASRLANSVQTEGTGSVKVQVALNDLEPNTHYFLCARGIGPNAEEGAVTKVEFTTSVGPDNLYSWERGRSGVPSFADITICTRGQHNYNPPLWTAERFAPHVSYKDGTTEHWLFDAFLCIEGFDGARGLTMSIVANGRSSAIKESWEELMDYWFKSDGMLSALDEAVGNAARRIGAPKHPRYVVLTLPDPIMLQVFSDKSSSTTYWGSLDGEVMNFSTVEHQWRVYRWFMDQCRERFNKLAPKNLELAGFYVLSEELPLAQSFYTGLGLTGDTSETWNAAYKRWEQLIPQASSYLNSCREGLWWIPYFYAPGYRVWKQMGFNMAWMQPNHYWDTSNQHPMSRSVTAMRQYGLGIELEFEYSMVYDQMKNGRRGPDGAGNMIFTEDDIPALRGRLREYLNAYKEYGFYGERSIAMYSGTDAFTQLAQSPDSRDQEMYLEICRYIGESPLKK